MNLIMKMLLDHKENCFENGRDCCNEESCIKVKVGMMNKTIATEEEEMNEDGLAMFMSCDQCGYFDFFGI